MKSTMQKFLWRMAMVSLPIMLLTTHPVGAGTKVTLVQPVDVLSFAPIAVAMGKGFFKQEGIDLDFVIIRGGPASGAAFVAGDAQFMSSGSFSPVQLVAKGQTNVLVINAFARALTFQVVASNNWLKKANVKPGAPPVEKLRSMKGATFGAPSFGGLSEHVIRYYLQNVGGLGKRDFSVVAVGFGAAMIGALQKGQIDGFGASPPTGPEVVGRGLGKVLLSGWDIPELGNMAYETLTTSKEYAKKNPETVRKVTRAVARGTNFIPKHTNEAIKVLQAHYKKMNPKIIAQSVRTLIPAFGGSGRMTKGMWVNAMKLWRATSLKKDVDIKEEGFWTNRFIVNIPKE